MKPPIAALDPTERERLLNDIYYLNTAELRGFCNAHGIPFAILIEAPNGRRTRSKDLDRKGIVIDRILHFLNTATIKPARSFARKWLPPGISAALHSSPTLFCMGNTKIAMRPRSS